MKHFTRHPSKVTAATDILSFKCPSCKNKTLYSAEQDVHRAADVDENELFICDECGGEFRAHPQYNGSIKFTESIESATNADGEKIDRRLSPTSKRYKGYRISLDTRYECYNIYDAHGELEDHGFRSVEDAMAHIDELVSSEPSTDAQEIPEFNDWLYDKYGYGDTDLTDDDWEHYHAEYLKETGLDKYMKYMNGNVYSSKQPGIRRKSTHRPVTAAKKRIARVGEWDNGHVIRTDWRSMSPEDAEEEARKQSLKDPESTYYVAYDDVMNPCSPYSWKNGKKVESSTCASNRTRRERAVKSSSAADPANYEDDIQEISQEFTSENTSINSSKLPAIFKMVTFQPGTINIDYGGGRFDNVADYLTQFDVINLVYDPYNRTPEHNKDVIRTVRKAGGADTATCSNVLNVIKEPEVRQNVLQNIKKLVKPNGTVYITVYEGSGKGNEGPTKSGYQLNKKTEGYLDEIKQVFPDAVRKGKLIVAHPSGSAVTSASRGNRKPKYWDTQFRVKVIDAYNKGELTYDNLVEWETAYNGGIRPTNLGTREILDYYRSHPEAITSAEDLSYDALTSEDYTFDLWTLVEDDRGNWVRDDKIDTYDDYATARHEASALAQDTPCQLVEVGPDGVYVAWTSRLPDRGLPSRYWEPEEYDEDEDVESATAINAGRLVDPPQHVIDSLIQILNDHGFVLDPRFKINPGKTWMGDIHLQVIDPDSNLPQDDFEALKDFIDRNMFTEIRALGADNDCPITWSFGVDDDGHVTGGLDINKKYVDDGQDDDIEECSVVEGADYGGAYDIESDQFFTKEDIVEFGNAVADRVSEELEDTNSTFVLSDVYMDTPTLLHVEVTDNNMNYSADVVIDMRRIRKPQDLHKYETDAVTQIEDDYCTQNNIPLDAATHINASENLDSLQTRIFQFLDDCQGYSDYNQKIEDVSDEFGMSPDEAEGYVWDWTLNHNAEWHDTADQEDVEGASVSSASGRKHSIKTLHDALLNRASQVMRMQGFPLNEIADYLVVDIQPAEDGWLNCEVRAELSYEGMSDMIEALNPIVQKYDKDAYFDNVTGGIISAYLPSGKFNAIQSATDTNSSKVFELVRYTPDSGENGPAGDEFDVVDWGEFESEEAAKAHWSAEIQDGTLFVREGNPSDYIEESTVLGAQGVDDYPEPPESNEPEERDSKEEIIIELDDDIVVEDDGDSVEFLRDPAFLEDEDEWTPEDEPMFQIDDGDSVYEHVMDLIIDSIPGEDGKYHIKGRLKLVYDVTLSYYYEGTSEEDQTTELNEDGSSSVYDKYQSEVMELDVTEI